MAKKEKGGKREGSPAKASRPPDITIATGCIPDIKIEVP
jgi:hypothetical protein